MILCPKQFRCVSSLRIIEWIRLEETLKIIEFNLPAIGRITTHQIRLPTAPYNMALNASRDGASSSSLGSMFQCLIILFLISNLNLSSFSLKLLLIFLSLLGHAKTLAPAYKFPSSTGRLQGLPRTFSSPS